MTERVEYRVLDEESVQDPETLVVMLGDVLDNVRGLKSTVGLTVALLLLHLGEINEPSVGTQPTIDTLKLYLDMVKDEAVHRAFADQLAQFLDAKE